jgi:hypothetical protein
MTPNRMGRMLVIVDAPHFYASLTIGRRRPMETVVVLEAAPILRWSLGKTWLDVLGYFERRGWKHQMRPDPAPPS